MSYSYKKSKGDQVHPSQLSSSGSHLSNRGEFVSQSKNQLSDSEPSLEQRSEHKGNKSKPVRPRTVKSKPVVSRWPDGLEFDVTNEVLTIGKVYLKFPIIDFK